VVVLGGVVVVVVDEVVVEDDVVDVDCVDDVDAEPVSAGVKVMGIVMDDAPGAVGNPSIELMTPSKPAQPAAPGGIAGITKLLSTTVALPPL
jgi:hypothetical protein